MSTNGEAGDTIAVVGEDNRFIRWTSRVEIHRHRLPHRSVHVLLFDSAGRLIIARRHRDKLTHPGCWDISCTGHVERSDYLGGPDERLDEVHAAVAHRELREELGVDAPLEEIGRFGPEPAVHYEHLHLYTGRSDGPFVPQPSEVEEVRRVTADEWDTLVRSGEPVTESLVWFVRWARQGGRW
jgi:isopentenyldiphosphate isomerase